MTPRLSSIGIVLADMGRSLAFYRRLGLEVPVDADDQPHAEAALPGGLRLMWDTEETARWSTPAGRHRLGVPAARWRSAATRRETSTPRTPG